MIADPISVNQAFDDQTIQDKLDEHRDDIWYEQLNMAPAIVNMASTGNIPEMIFADYYSNFNWLEGDAVIQGWQNGQPWKVIMPVSSDYITGHFQFEKSVFTSGTFPGQYPPVFFIGKSYDPYVTSADLLDMRINTLLLTTYNFSSDGQRYDVGDIIKNMKQAALDYRRQARPKIMKMVRRDVAREIDSRATPILGGDGSFGGIY
jgi:hypothetical protein